MRTLIAVLMMIESVGVMAAAPNAAEPVSRGKLLEVEKSLASKGDVVAQYFLGLFYERGEVVPENDAEAVKWYRKAADGGYAKAQVALGFMYSQGNGVPQDYIQAYKWYNLAAAQGSADGKHSKKMVAEKMTRGQIAEAQRLSSEWSPTKKTDGGVLRK
jgi:TPR repeat protein